MLEGVVFENKDAHPLQLASEGRESGEVNVLVWKRVHEVVSVMARGLF